MMAMAARRVSRLARDKGWGCRAPGGCRWVHGQAGPCLPWRFGHLGMCGWQSWPGLLG